MTTQTKDPRFLGRLLRVLHQEDNPADFDLSLRELKKAGLEVAADMVKSREEFSQQLASNSYDLVLADYRLPGWCGLDALELLRQQHRDLPLLLVTGALGEEMAVECLRRGAADYILKDHLDQLPDAVCAAMEAVWQHRERKRTETSLRAEQARFRSLADSIASAIFVYQGTTCRYANHGAEVTTGYTREELMALSSWDLIHPDSRKLVIDLGLAHILGGQAESRYEMKILTKQGETRWLDCVVGKTDFDGRPAGLITAFDITGRMLAEDRILHQVADDALTGLANARTLSDVFQSEAKRSDRTGRCFALLRIDVVGMKKYNELHGELVGSQALCRVANILRMNCRGLDLPVRWDDDEFAVILPETSLVGAQQLARRISQRLANESAGPSILVRAGIAVYPRDGETLESLLNIAERNSRKAPGGSGRRLAIPA